MPPVPSAPLRHGRPLKRWCYVAFLAEELMACAAVVHVGPLPVAFWAVWDRRRHRFRQGTTPLRRAGLEVSPARVRIPAANLELTMDPDAVTAIEVSNPHRGGGQVWTRKRAGVPARAGTLPGRAVIDETAGHHARRTEWWWAAGVGRDADGRPLGFNLVRGVGDPERGSERAVWREGSPTEPGPVAFDPDLRAIRAADGSVLRFAPEAERRRRERLGPLRSEYRAPFGTFAGELPGGITVHDGLGVCEHHRAWW